jgi:hypothetical protein
MDRQWKRSGNCETTGRRIQIPTGGLSRSQNQRLDKTSRAIRCETVSSERPSRSSDEGEWGKLRMGARPSLDWSLTSSFLLVFFLVSVAGEFIADDGESGL